jgi:hypothetical protein
VGSARGRDALGAAGGAGGVRVSCRRAGQVLVRLDVVAPHLVGAVDVGRQQGAVGQHVDQARDAAALLVDAFDGLAPEELALAAGDLQPVLDVLLDLAAVHGFEVVVHADALAHLGEPGGRSGRAAGLAGQDHPHLLAGAHVGQQAHALGVRPSGSGLVHDQQHALALAVEWPPSRSSAPTTGRPGRQLRASTRSARRAAASTAAEVDLGDVDEATR